MTGIFTTAFAGSIGYYSSMINCNHRLLEAHENFVKQSIRNRCYIATGNGVLILTVPLVGRYNHMPLKEARICYRQNWQRQHIKSLETAYQSSPFFEYYVDELKSLYQLKPDSLLEWNSLVHQLIEKWLKLNLSYEFTTCYEKVYAHIFDYRGYTWEQKQALPYHQVFESKQGFIPHLSIFDLLFNCGNQAVNYLKT